MDLEHLKNLLALLSEHDVNEFHYKDDEQSIRLRLGPVVGPAPVPVAVPAVAAPAADAPPPAPVTTPEAPQDDANIVVVESPMVGTFYRASAPDAPPYVEVGSQVSKGTVLCIVEAMKLMNEIEAEQAGTVVEILVENGQPVQFGQPLFKLRV